MIVSGLGEGTDHLHLAFGTVARPWPAANGPPTRMASAHPHHLPLPQTQHAARAGVRAPNDRDRYTLVRVQPPWHNTDCGPYTGRDMPCDGKPYQAGFVFYPEAEDIRLTISRLPCELKIDPESGGAVSWLWLFEVADDLSTRPAEIAPTPGPQREIGLAQTHPGYLYELYGRRGENLVGRLASLKAFGDYAAFVGLNRLEYNAVNGADTSETAYYPSAIWNHYRGGAGTSVEFYHNYWEETGVARMGEFGTDFWGAGTMFPAGRFFFRPLLHALRTNNVQSMALFSWERGSSGHEGELRRFCRASRAIPALAPDAFEGAVTVTAGPAADEGLWVHRFGPRLALVNESPQPRTVTLELPRADSAEALYEYASQRQLAPPGPAGKVPVALELDAFDLRVLGFED